MIADTGNETLQWNTEMHTIKISESENFPCRGGNKENIWSWTFLELWLNHSAEYKEIVGLTVQFFPPVKEELLGIFIIFVSEFPAVSVLVPDTLMSDICFHPCADNLTVHVYIVVVRNPFY